jgi:hypothetical protein
MTNTIITSDQETEGEQIPNTPLPRTTESLNKEKALLLRKDNAAPLDWLLLANDYAAIYEARKMEYCLMRAKKLESKADPDEL